MEHYLLIGNWRSKKQRGIDICRYLPETGEIIRLGNCFPEVTVGNMEFDRSTETLYFTDEVIQRENFEQYGGWLTATRFNSKDGSLEMLNDVPSLSTNPAYVCKDKKDSYVLVSHHAGQSKAAKIRKIPGKGFVCETLTDDAALVLFRTAPDGSVLTAEDVFIPTSKPGKSPHLHFIYSEPDCRFFVACDKGSDTILTFCLDRKNGKINCVGIYECEDGDAPRYAAFHPNTDVFYTNNENVPVLYSWKYSKDGTCERIQTVRFDGGKKEKLPSDIVISPNGEYIYVSSRRSDEVFVFSADHDGYLTKKGVYDCLGRNPRGLAISPDGRYLFIANIDSGTVCRYKNENGLLSDGRIFESFSAPGCLCFI